MKPCILACLLVGWGSLAFGSWYWPFGSDDEQEPPRISELMEPATEAIDEAAELQADGKTAKAVEKYREVLDILDRIEQENPDRADTEEFTTVRTKRAYVNSAIDSILLAEARDNARAVAITDTTELEERYATLKGRLTPGETTERVGGVDRPKMEKQLDRYMRGQRRRAKRAQYKGVIARTEKKIEAEIKELREEDPESHRAMMLETGLMIRRGQLDAARDRLEQELRQRPNDPGMMNMLASTYAVDEDLNTAQSILLACLNANPRDYRSYYNMARLTYQNTGNREIAKRYYDTGRKVGGMRNRELELDLGMISEAEARAEAEAEEDDDEEEADEASAAAVDAWDRKTAEREDAQ